VDQSASRKRDVRLIVGAVGISALGDFLRAASLSQLAVAFGLALALYRRPLPSAEPELAG